MHKLARLFVVDVDFPAIYFRCMVSCGTVVPRKKGKMYYRIVLSGHDFEGCVF